MVNSQSQQRCGEVGDGLMCVLSHSVMSDSETPWTVARQAPLCSWDSPGQNTGVGCHALLQRIFPTQGSNSGLPHCRWILYQLSNEGSPIVAVSRSCSLVAVLRLLVVVASLVAERRL